MLLEAPPSRYRVVERGGRLTVIDTRSDGAVLSARDLIARDGARRQPEAPVARPAGAPRPPVAAIPVRPPSFRPPATATRRPVGRVMEAERVQPLPDQSRRFHRNDPLSEPPGLLRAIASTVAGGVRDDTGRLLLTTARWYDARAERTIALSAGAETRLGAMVLAVVVGLLVALLLFVSGEPVGWVLAIAVFVAIGQGKPVVTRWLDRLA